MIEKTNKSAKTFEAQKVKLQVKNKSIMSVTNIYRPPYNKKNKYTYNDFEAEYESLIINDSGKSNDFLIGDLNIHMEKKDDPDAINFAKLLQRHDQKQLIDEATHIKGGTLDLIMISKSNENYATEVGDRITSSDHYPIIVTIKVEKAAVKNENRQIQIRKTKHLKIDDVKRKIVDTEIEKKVAEAADVDEAVEIYNMNLQKIYNELCPMQLITISDKRKQSPWFNKSLMELRSSVLKAYKIHKQHPEDVKLKAKYNRDRNEYAKLVKNTRQKYYNDELCKSKDPKKLYGLIKILLGKKKNTSLPTKFSKEQLPDEFRMFYVNKVQGINNEIKRKMETLNIDIEKFKPDVPPCVLTHFKELTED